MVEITIAMAIPKTTVDKLIRKFRNDGTGCVKDWEAQVEGERDLAERLANADAHRTADGKISLTAEDWESVIQELSWYCDTNTEC